MLVAFFALIAFSNIARAHAPQADSSSVEWIKTYFNMPADYSVTLRGNMSNSSSDLIGSLETLLQQAHYSVAFAIYELEHPRISRALADTNHEKILHTL